MKKVVVIGGGPCGLFFALLIKRRFPGVDIEVHEQNPANATFGFGIILAEGGHGAFRDADPEVADAITAASMPSRDRLFSLDGTPVFIEGGPWGGAIARLKLLNVLQGLCRQRGIAVHYAARIENPDVFDADLIVGADGVNSVVRRAYEGEFGVTSWTLKSRLAWYGTTKTYPNPILSFRTNTMGNFWAVAYSHTATESTFVAECDAEAWRRAGLNRMTMDERLRFSQELFSAELGGHSLLSNRSDWVSLPVIRCAKWFVGHRVLIGDALRSPHPSIGSGTRIAMEDAIALADALTAGTRPLESALADYQETRAVKSAKLVTAMEKSFMWYETVGEKLASLDVVDLAFDYMTRTGRIDAARLRAEYPKFMKAHEQRWNEWVSRSNGAISA